MRALQLYLLEVLVFVVSFAATLSLVLAAALLFGELTGARRFDQGVYYVVTAIIAAVMWNLGRLYEHYRMGGFGQAAVR